MKNKILICTLFFFIFTDEAVYALSTACVIFSILLIASIFAYCYLRLKTGNNLQRLTDTHELALQGPMVEVVSFFFFS